MNVKIIFSNVDQRGSLLKQLKGEFRIFPFFCSFSKGIISTFPLEAIFFRENWRLERNSFFSKAANLTDWLQTRETDCSSSLARENKLVFGSTSSPLIIYPFFRKRATNRGFTLTILLLFLFLLVPSHSLWTIIIPVVEAHVCACLKAECLGSIRGAQVGK